MVSKYRCSHNAMQCMQCIGVFLESYSNFKFSNFQARYIMAYVTYHIFFNSFMYRTYLILYANGLIKNGKPNLKVFSQLFWIVNVSFFAINFFIFPLSLQLKGKFPFESTSGEPNLLYHSILINV